MRKPSPDNVQLGLDLSGYAWCEGGPAVTNPNALKGECPRCGSMVALNRDGATAEHRAERYSLTWTEDDGTIRVRRFPTRSMAERTAATLAGAGIDTTLEVRP